MKSVCICVATYNGEKYLKEQLDSLLNQTYENINIIVQDDCSSDKTMEILQNYQHKITIYKNEKNLGYIKNFESLIKKANGDLIALCDQDDIWQKDKIEILVNQIKEYSLIYSNSLLIDKNKKSLNKTLKEKLKNNFIDSNNALNFVFDNCVSAHSMLFKKELLPHLTSFPEKIFFDQYIAIIASSLNGIKYIDKELVLYRQHDSNTVGNHKKKKISILEKIKNKLNKKASINLLILNKLQEIQKIKTLSAEDKEKLSIMINFHKDFKNRFFNLKALFFYLKNKNILFAISTKNKTITAIKKSIGYKLYKVLPIL